jgi:uncharacterized delta-60 repeat protein
MHFEQGHTAGRRRTGESRRSAARPSGSDKAWQKGDRVRTRASLGILAAGAAALAATAIGAAAPAQAASAGSLDPSFGTGGLAAVPADFSAGTMLPQPDGTILVLATVTNTVTDGFEFGVLRYNANGTLDTSFGTGGEAVASFPGATAEPAGIFVQSDGKIVVAGSEDIPNEGENAAVVRFNADGTLDTSFGSNGEVTTHFPSGNANLPGNDTANTVLVQADGKILMGGGLETCVNPRNAQCISETALARLNPDGTLDTSFGSGGFAVQKAGSFGVIAMGEDSAGDIFVQNGIGGGQPTLGEYSPAGVPDSTVTFPSSSSITVSSTGIGFQSNGTYAEGQSVKVTTRQSGGPTAASVVVNSLPSGAPVAGFSNPPFDYANEIGQGQNGIAALAFQSNGDVVAAGVRCSGTGKFCTAGSDELGVARLTATGSLDSTFGAGGVTTFSFTSDPSALAIQSDGDILIAFQNCSSTSCQSSIARVLG